MPITIRDLDGGIGVVITGWGIVGEEEYVDSHSKHLTQDEDKLNRYRYSLVDWTAVKEAEVSTEAISLIAGYCESTSEVNPDTVVAIAANQNLIYGLSRMWEGLAGVTGWETMVFKNREDAEAWITKKVKEKYGIDVLTFV